MHFHGVYHSFIKSLIVLLLLLEVSLLQGQTGVLRFNHLTVEDDLSDGSNAHVYQDSRGFIWISSVAGLNRYDGTQVKIYFANPKDSCSMVGTNVQSPFFEDGSSRMYFNTYEAMNVYDWKSDCFQAYHIYIDSVEQPGLNSFYMDQQHNIWLLCSEYLYTFHIPSNSFKQIYRTEKPGQRGIGLPDRNGNTTHIWTYWLNGQGVEEFTLDANQQVIDHHIIWDSASTQPLVIRDIINQGDSLLWVLSDQSVWKYNVLEKKGQLFPLDQEDASSFDFMNDSTLLIGFKKVGLWEFNITKAKLSVQYLHQPDDDFSLLSNTINVVTKVSSGGLWMSTWGKGLSYTQPEKKKFTTFFPQNLFPGLQSFDPVALVPYKANMLLCATKSSGLYLLHRKGPMQAEITKLSKPDVHDLQGSVRRVIKDDLGHFWVLNFSGFSVFDPESERIQHFTDENNVASDGVPWGNQEMVFSGRGLFNTTGNMEDGYTLKKNPAISDTINTSSLFLDSHGRLWYNADLTHYVIMDTTDFKVLASIPMTGQCSQIVERDSTIWVCSIDGLFEIDADSLKLRKVHQKNTGMPVSSFNSMVMDENQRLWLTSNEGIVRYDPSKDSSRFYTQEDGLPAYQFTHVAYRFDDGEIWFAAIDAVTRFYPNQIKDSKIKAIPQITEIQVNDKVPIEKLVCELTGATNVPLIEKLIFHYDQNTLAFRVNALEYSSPRLNKVKFQMEHLDAQPVETPSGSIIRYPNMPPGDYKLVLYASNSDGYYNPDPRILMIRIIPPFYKTLWFRILVALFSIGLLAYIIYLRFSKALELQKVRLKLYENLHDDVGSRLTAIVLSAEDLERNDNLHHPKIQAISKIAKSIVGNMRRLVWAIDPENDKMSNLIQKITHDKSLILDESISFQVKVDDQLKNNIVPGEIRYQIISICNEAFNNISKYAKATLVTVSISKENRNYHLTIQDNGIGFDTSKAVQNALTGSGYGLNNMKRRASRVKGKLELYSKPGEGTRIEADFPY